MRPVDDHGGAVIEDCGAGEVEDNDLVILDVAPITVTSLCVDATVKLPLSFTRPAG